MKIISLSVLFLQGLAVITAQHANSTLFKNLRETLDHARNKTGVPGMSVAILHKGKLVFAEGFGKRNDRDPFTPETVSMIGSISKSITAGAVGELVAEGIVDWNTTPLSEYLPEFQLQDGGFTRQITLADALSHRTGCPSLDYAWFFNTESRTELIKRMRTFSCGTKMQPYVTYNNVIYAIGGIAAAKAANVEYEDLVKEKIFKPLGLKSAGFTMEGMTKFKEYSSSYWAETYEDVLKSRAKRLKFSNSAERLAPAGNIHANVLDLVRWGQVMMKFGEVDGKQVLSKASITEILSGQSIAIRGGRISAFPPTSTYGLGWVLDSFKGNNLFWHNGAIDGYVSSLMVLPDSELVIGVLANLEGATLPDLAGFHIVDEILGLPKTLDWIDAAITGTKTVYDMKEKANKDAIPAQIKNAPATHKLSEFAGVYTHPIYGDLSITYDSKKKGQELGFKYRVFEGEMSHYHYDSFKTIIRVPTIVSHQLVSFITSEKGSVSGVQVSLDSRVVFEKRS